MRDLIGARVLAESASQRYRGMYRQNVTGVIDSIDYREDGYPEDPISVYVVIRDDNGDTWDAEPESVKLL